MLLCLTGETVTVLRKLGTYFKVEHCRTLGLMGNSEVTRRAVTRDTHRADISELADIASNRYQWLNESVD